MYALLLQKLAPLGRVVGSIVVVTLVGLLTFAVYQYARSRIAADVYKERLESLSGEYESLRQTYNEAVKRTAVTELVVEDGKVCVAIRTSDGKERVVTTPYDPTHEVYVDCVVVDGRLWIRRVFDSKTRPQDGVVIDPSVAQVDWDHQSARYGKAIYRPLSEGRWLVTVTGDGSLGLVKTDKDERSTLSPPPPVRDYPQIEKELTQKVEAISPSEVFNSLVSPK